jgi:predicted choloylglycine hydrolase
LHSQYLEKWFTSSTQRFLATAAARGFASHLLPEHRAEVEALAASTRIDPDQMMLAQCFLDLSPMTACSTIALPAEASPDGVARMGRNLDFPSFNLADKQSVVLVFRPDDGRYAFAAVSWPGLIGVLSGMNEHGLTLANMEVTRSGSIPVAMPYTLLYRAVLERCRTVDEAIAFLEKSKRQTPNNLMLMDAAGNRAVVEILPQKITVRRGQPGKALMSTNHQRAQDTQTVGLCWRYDTLNKLATSDFGDIAVPELEQMMAKVAQDNFTLQSMVFEPANRMMYLAVVRNAPNTSEFYRLDLKTLFAGTG